MSPHPTRPQPWITVSSKVAFEDRWIRLIADSCETAEGRKISPYYVFEAQSFAQVAAVTEANELVMVRQYRQGTKDIHLELPAGIIDASDIDPMATAKRELLEETGYGSQDWRHLATWHVNPARQTNLQHLYFCRNAQVIAAPETDGDESLVLELVPLSIIMDFVTSGRIDSTQNVASILRLLHELKSEKAGGRPPFV